MKSTPTSQKLPRRLWKVYLLSDVCTDYTWAYDSVCAMKADDAALLKAELEAGTRYNLVHSRQVEYFLEAYPHLANDLFAAIRRGQITLNPVRNMTVFADMSLEEIVRSFYPARRLARTYGLNDQFANIQETPSATWILPTIFANIGVKHLVRSLLPYECPWAKRLTEPPIYEWEGPDGSRVLVRLRKEDYVEGRFLLKGLEATNENLHTRILPEYEACHAYPFDAIGLVGCYGDLSPNSKDFPAQKAAVIAAYNAQDGKHAHLIDASHADFWADIASQLVDGAAVPVVRGDYGTSWEAWPACLAADFAAYRRAQVRAPLADRLSAILCHGSRLALLESSWNALLSLADHAWNGSSDESRKLNASLRRGWQQEANAGFDAVIAEGMNELARCVPAEVDSLLAFNHQSWPRTALARLSGQIPAALHDPKTGAAIPVQQTEEDGEKVGYCVLDVPSVGYQTYPISLIAPASLPTLSSSTALSSPFYTLTIDTATGALASLYDKTRRVELVDSASPYRLNEAVYTTAPAGAPEPYAMYVPTNFAGAVEQRPRLLEIEPPTSGAVFDEIKIRAILGDIRLVTTYRLFHALDRLDICNEVVKQATSEKEQLDFVFPFSIPERRYRIETPGVILDPEVDRLPGSGQSVHAVRRFVDVFNDHYGVTLAMLDSGLVQLGHRTTGEDPLAPDATNATVLCLALGDVYDWNEAIHDQGGATKFTFRYRIQGHAGGFDPVAAIHFGWEDDLEIAYLPAHQPGSLPATAHSFLTFQPAKVILFGCKPADTGNGLALRLWNCTEEAQLVSAQLHGMGRLGRAMRTDLLESPSGETLPIGEDGIRLSIPGRGLCALRVDVVPAAQ